MIVGTLAVLVFALVYWRLLPARFRSAALLIFGVALFSMMAWSIAANLAVVLLVVLILAVTPKPLGTGIAVVVALLALLLNKYASLPAFQVVGLSYITFRLISLCRTVAREKRGECLLCHAEGDCSSCHEIHATHVSGGGGS